jgi:hypothetical protein
MPWFKVDDGLHAHRKVARAGIDAMGLWVVAGSWCADQLTDGFIPDYMARKLDEDFEVHAASLVAAKLWIVGEKDDETGWWFHQWSEEGRQPTAASVNAKRGDARERMAKLRADRAEAAKNKEKRSQDVRANKERSSANVFAGDDSEGAFVAAEVAAGGPGGSARTSDSSLSNVSGEPYTRSELQEGTETVRANTLRTSQEVASTPTRPDPTHTSISNEIEEQPFSSAVAALLADLPPGLQLREDVEKICRHLADRIEDNGSKRPSITKGWRDAARLMLDKDGRTEEEIHGAIEWCQNDQFWRGNVLSLPKLRDKYDQMRLQAQRATPINAAQQRFAQSAQVIEDMRRLDEAEAAGTRIPDLFALPPGRTA